MRAGRFVLIAIALAYLALLLLLPLGSLFVRAWNAGAGTFATLARDTDVRSALRLSAIAVTCAVVVNTLFGLSAAWLVTRHRFPFRRAVLVALDVPLMISPVISGMLFVFLFGARGLFSPLLNQLGLEVIFAAPGVVIVTIFVTMPYVARELIAFMETEGTDGEEAAVSLGARGWRTFFKVTLPAIRWSLLYGIVLCAARALGEFGAVSVVSGHIRGVTNTLTLEIEILYNDYQSDAAFALASLLTGIAVVATIAKQILAYRIRGETAASKRSTP